MGREEYSFVEIVIQTYEPGDVAWSSYLNEHSELFDADLDEVTEQIPEVIAAQQENNANELVALAAGKRSWLVNSKAYEADLRVLKPFKAYGFRCFGQGFLEGTASGIDHEIQQMDAEYVFQSFLPELDKIGQQVIESAKVKMQGLRAEYQPDYKTVRFVTLWSYTSWQDSYSKEFDSSWELIGVVTPRTGKGLCDSAYDPNLEA